jgi:hypothetical protein
MILYVYMFIIIGLIGLLDLTTISRRLQLIISIVISIFLIVLSSVRWETGTDWIFYYPFFYRNNAFYEFVNDNLNFEIGYVILNYFIKSISNEYTIVLFILAALCIGIKTRFIFKYATLPLCAIFLNFSTYIGDIFLIRQTLAIAITLLSFDFIVKKRFWYFVVLLGIAATFHRTALVFFPAYFIYHMNITRKRLFLISIIAISFDVFSLGPTIIRSVLEIAGFEHTDIWEKINAYYTLGLNNENFGNAIPNEIRIFAAYLRRIIFLPFLIYFKNRFSKENSAYSGMINLVVIGYALFFMLSGVSMDLAGRSSIYYYMYEIVLVPCILLLTKNLKYKLAIYSFFVLFCLIKYYYAIYTFYDLYIPFHTIIDKYF